MRAIFVAAVLAPVALVAASQLRGNLATKLGWSAPGMSRTRDNLVLQNANFADAHCAR